MQPFENLSTRIATTIADMQAALSVRRAVFIEEQGVDEAIEIDEHDADPAANLTAIHMIGWVDDVPVATGRLLLPHNGEGPHIGRLAVLREHRGKGYGQSMMLALQAEATRRDLRDITIAAQLHALQFYERLGYRARGDIFIEANIEHRWMDIQL